MRLINIREASQQEIEAYWPGNFGRWKYIFDCAATEPIPEPFNLNDILGSEAKEYTPIMTFKKISPKHEKLILPFLLTTSTNTTDEIPSPNRFVEGASKSIIVNAYERDPNARKDCLKKYGYDCQICGLNFESEFGMLGKEYIHVHHRIPLADIGEEYIVNPSEDLIPLCPNCHAMIHRRKPALKVQELIQIRNEIKKWNN
jgi:hypothetical protein